MKPNVRKVLAQKIASINSPIALMLSSGVDSRSLFFECLSQNKEFSCYTFIMEGIISSDYIEAKSLCVKFGITHHTITLPNNIDVLKKDIIKLKELGANKKTDFQCFWPFLYAYKEVKENAILTGLGADGHFCISKKGMIHYRDKIDEFRELTFNNPSYCQMHLHKVYNNNKECISPYLSQEMIEEFKGTTWEQINKPREKYAIVNAYNEYFSQIKIYKHTNFQLGDSGISKHFENLLNTELNTNNFKSVQSIFNRIKIN